MILFADGKYILLANGAWESVGVSQMIDISLDKQCQDIGKYPNKIYNAAGSLVDDTPFICGGQFWGAGDSNQCYVYSLKDKAITYFKLKILA